MFDKWLQQRTVAATHTPQQPRITHSNAQQLHYTQRIARIWFDVRDTAHKRTATHSSARTSHSNAQRWQHFLLTVLTRLALTAAAVAGESMACTEVARLQDTWHIVQSRASAPPSVFSHHTAHRHAHDAAARQAQHRGAEQPTAGAKPTHDRPAPLPLRRVPPLIAALHSRPPRQCWHQIPLVVTRELRQYCERPWQARQLAAKCSNNAAKGLSNAKETCT